MEDQVMGIDFYQTRMGKEFYDHTMKGIWEEMKHHNKLLREQNNLTSQQILELGKVHSILTVICEKLPLELKDLPASINQLCEALKKAII